MTAQEVIDKLYPKLVEYLTIHQKLQPDSTGKFKCFTGKHEDKHPSLGILPNNPTVFHCFSCMLPDEKVITDKGLIAIKNIVPGDKVLDHNGNYSEVLFRARHNDSGKPLYYFKLGNIDDSIAFTYDHTMLVVEKYGNEYEIVNKIAEHVNIGDYFIHPQTFSEYIDLPDSFTGNEDEIIQLKQAFINQKVPFRIIRNDNKYTIIKSEHESSDCFYHSIGDRYYCFLRVESKEKADPAPIVYDITVEGSDTFTCKYFSVHNCGISGNIFHAAHYLENLPIDGQDFFKLTLPTLAKKFGIEYEPEDLDPEDKDRYQMLHAYKSAADVITSNNQEKLEKFLSKRGWTLQTAQELGIGVIESHANYMRKMENIGWNRDYLFSIELEKKNIFNGNNLIFIIRDINKRPIAFASRDMKWESESKTPKYYNSKTSIIYKKGQTLWNLQNTTQNEPLWIVEGYADCITMWQNGIKNVVALGGTAFTSDHVELLKEHKYTNLIFMFDNDAPGQEMLASVLKNYFRTSINFDVKVCTYGNLKAKDPDEVITKYGIDKFKELEILDAFTWDIYRRPNEDKHKLAQEKAAEIASEISAIKRDWMIKTLSEYTEIPYDIINDDVKRKMGDKDYKYDEAKRKFKEEVVTTIEKSLFMKKEDPERFIQKIASFWNNISSDVRPITHDLDKYKTQILDLKEHSLKMPEIPFKMNTFKTFYRLTEGIPSKASFITLGGLPNVGKTSLLRAMVWDMLTANDDLIVLFFSFDDPFSKTLFSFLSISSKLRINDFRRAGVNIQSERKKQVWNSAWDKFINGEIYKRLLIKDATVGSSISTMEQYLNYYRKMYPDKKFLVALDSLHKLRDFGGKDLRDKYSRISAQLKELTTKYNIPLISIVELRKLQNSRPSTQDIKETVNIEYDSDMIWLLHQEYHNSRDSFMVKQINSMSGTKIIPVDELIVAKNKEGDFKGSIYMYFLTEISRFEDVPENELISMIEKEKKRKKRSMWSISDDDSLPF